MTKDSMVTFILLNGYGYKKFYDMTYEEVLKYYQKCVKHHEAEQIRLEKANAIKS